MKKNDPKDLHSLNETLYDDFYMQELESRLETDPFLVGGILDIDNQLSNEETDPLCVVDNCEKTCGEYDSCTIKCSCILDGIFKG